MHFRSFHRPPRLSLLCLGALLLALLWHGSLVAQPVSGDTLLVRTIDTETGALLRGATIRLAVRDTAGRWSTLPTGAVTDDSGAARLRAPLRDTLRITATTAGYLPAEDVWWPGASERIIFMEPALQPPAVVSVTGVRRSRSVEDGCCRVESIREEVQQQAPFTPGVTGILGRYSSCTSLRTSCGIDNASFLRLRGLEPTNITVLLDGVPVFGGTDVFYGLDLLPTQAIGMVRIAEGASSALYGNGAISGIIDIIPRMPTEETEIGGSTSLAVEEGSVGERTAGVAYTGLIDEVGVAAFATYSGEPLHDDSVAHGYERGSLMLRSNLLLGSQTELNATALGALESRSGTARISIESGTVEWQERMSQRRGGLILQLGHTASEQFEFLGSAYAGGTTLDGGYGPSDVDATQSVLYGSARGVLALGSHTLTFGGEARRERLDERSALGIGYDFSVLSLYSQEEWALSEEVLLLGSMRYDRHSWAGGVFSPRGSIRWKPDPSLTLRMMVGTGFRGEVLFNEDHRTLHGIVRWRRNPALTPVRSTTVNLETGWRTSLGEEGALDLNGSFYHTHIAGRPLADAELLEQDILFYRNDTASARLRGLEIQARMTVNAHWSGSLALAVIDYARRSGGTSMAIPLSPRFNVDASLLWRDEESGWLIEGWGSVIGPQVLPRNSTERAATSPAYLLASMRFEKSFGVWSLFVGGRNLLDERQENRMPLATADAFGRADGSAIWGPVEGRSLFAGVHFRLHYGKGE